jgi:regulator of sirC expression with transglutaminase-like and TPR domain
MWRSLALAAVCLLAVAPPCSAGDRPDFAASAQLIRSVTATPESVSFADAKLAIDSFVDPSVDTEAALAEIDAIVATVRRMLATIPSAEAAKSIEKLRALQTFLYEPGWWNESNPFEYDFSVADGQNVTLQSLPRYLGTRRGNCVSMPILFLILGERLGLDVTLSTAPLHVFVKWTDDATGRTYSFEATSGKFAPDVFYRYADPSLTDLAVANGVYLKTLSRREALAVIATTALDSLFVTKRYEEAIAVADVLLEAYPAHAYALAKKSAAYSLLLEKNVFRAYPDPDDIPRDLIPYANALWLAQKEALDQALALGWREPELNLPMISRGRS